MIPPILVNGLTGSASQLIIGYFQLGFLEVEIEELPVGGQDYPEAVPVQDRVRVTFRIKYNDKRWVKSYITSRKKSRILILIGTMINTVTTSISLSIGKMRKKFNIFRIRKK